MCPRDIFSLCSNSFKISKEVNNQKISTEYKEEKERILGKIVISGYIDDVKITEEHHLIIQIKKNVCDVCSKRFGGYHEAIIQVRADRRKLAEEEIEDIRYYVELIVKNMQNKGNRGLFITDIGKEHGGIDFYISDKGSALTITKKIQENYGGDLKKSSKNIGIKDGKQIYKMTYLIRLPAFGIGDFIQYGVSIFNICKISRNKVHILELSTWEEKIVDIKEIEDINIFGGTELIKEMILISQTNDEIQVMNPDTYKTIEIKKPTKFHFKNKKINTVEICNELFILPENSNFNGKNN